MWFLVNWLRSDFSASLRPFCCGLVAAVFLTAGFAAVAGFSSGSHRLLGFGRYGA